MQQVSRTSVAGRNVAEEEHSHPAAYRHRCCPQRRMHNWLMKDGRIAAVPALPLSLTTHTHHSLPHALSQLSICP